jgi:hypothetical protein
MNPSCEEDKVKVSHIEPLIRVDDTDERSIGRDDQVLRDITEEIPTDQEWKTAAFKVQANSFDIFNPKMSKAYSNTFSDLLSFCHWIQRIGREVQRSVGKAVEDEDRGRTDGAELQDGRRTDVAGLHTKTSTQRNNGRTGVHVNVVKKYDSDEEAYEDPPGEDERGDDTVDVNTVIVSCAEEILILHRQLHLRPLSG